MTEGCWLCALFYTGLFVGFMWFLILLIKISNRVAGIADSRKPEPPPTEPPAVDQDKDAYRRYQETRPES